MYFIVHSQLQEVEMQSFLDLVDKHCKQTADLVDLALTDLVCQSTDLVC